MNISELVTLSLRTDCDGTFVKENPFSPFLDREEKAVLSRNRSVLMPLNDFHREKCTGGLERGLSLERSASSKLMRAKSQSVFCEMGKIQPLPVLTRASSIGGMSDKTDELCQSSDCDSDNEIMTSNMPGYQHASVFSKQQGRSKSSSSEIVLPPLSTIFRSRSPSPELETLRRTKSMRSQSPFANLITDHNSRFHQSQGYVYRWLSGMKVVDESDNSDENINKENNSQCQTAPNVYESISVENVKAGVLVPNLLSPLSTNGEVVDTALPEKRNAETQLELQHSLAMVTVSTEPCKEIRECDDIATQENSSYSTPPPTPDTTLAPEVSAPLPSPNAAENSTTNNPAPIFDDTETLTFNSSLPTTDITDTSILKIPAAIQNTVDALTTKSPLPSTNTMDALTLSTLLPTQDNVQIQLGNSSSIALTNIQTKATVIDQLPMKRQLFGNPSTDSVSNSGLSNIYKCPLTCVICYPKNRIFNTSPFKPKTAKKQRSDTYSVTKKRTFGINRFQKITTRSSNRRLRQRTPNHAFQHVFMKKVEVFKAVEEGDLELVKTLVQDTGATVRREKTNCTLLHVAAANNHPDVVLFLLQLISPNVVNKDGQTPAHLAAMKGHTQVLRILVGDMEFDSNKLDKGQKTYRDLLSECLIKLLLAGDIKTVKSLVKAGADPDMQVKSASWSILSRELGITTPRLLAQNLHQHHFLQTVSKANPAKNNIVTKDTSNVTLESSLRRKSRKIPGRNRPYPLKLSLMTSGQQMSGPDVYKMDTEPRGYVCVLNYNTFQNRPDLHLQGSHSDVNNLANIFGKMGYTGDVHSSLSLKETKDVLLRVRDMEVLDDVGCAIFIISSHGVGHDSFLTGDMNYLRTEWVMNLFRDSECPRLKNKPKMFIFNMHNNPVVGMNTADEPVFVLPRLTEPLQDTVCLHASGVWPSSFNSSMDGTPFITSLCRSLALYAHHKELGDLYKECLTELKKVTQDIVPQLRNFGFTKKFYFNPKFQL